MKLIFECTIAGRAYVKKNTQRAVGSGRFKRIIYSPQYVAWASAAVYQMKRSIGFVNHLFPYKGPVRLEAVFEFKNHSAEADLSALYEGVQDCLETAGIVSNDRQVQSHDGSTKAFTGGAARTVVKVYALD